MVTVQFILVVRRLIFESDIVYMHMDLNIRVGHLFIRHSPSARTGDFSHFPFDRSTSL